MANKELNELAELSAEVDDADLLLVRDNSDGISKKITASNVRSGLVKDTDIGSTVQAYSAVLDGTTASFTTADESHLDAIEANATADQTGAEIKTAYEAEADTNAFDDAAQAKLAGVEANATADQTGAEIKTAYEAEVDTNAFDDAAQAKLAGVDTGATDDQTPSELMTAIQTVDGTGSGLDADLVDGNEASALLDRANHTGTQNLASISDSGALAALNTVGTSEIDNDAVTYDKLEDVAQDTVVGRVSAGAGNAEELTATQVRTLLNVEDGADVTDETNVTAALDNATLSDVGTPQNSDQILLLDASNSNELAYASFVEFGGGGGGGTGDTYYSFPSALGATPTLDRDNGNIQYGLADQNFTIAISNFDAAGDAITFLWRQDTGGGFDVTWPAGIDWANGVEPTWDTSDDAVNAATLFSPDGGTTIIGISDYQQTSAFALDDLTDVTATGGSTGDVLTQQAGGAFAMQAPSGGGGGGLLTVSEFSGGDWVSDSSGVLKAINGASLDVTFTAPASGDVLAVLGTLNKGSTSNTHRYFGFIEDPTGTPTNYERVLERGHPNTVRSELKVLITGLTPSSSYTIRPAFRTQGATETVTVYADTDEVVVVEVWEAP